MKNDEAFNQSIKSSPPSADLIFRLVRRSDRETIVSLMAQRNPRRDISEIYKGTDREFDTIESDLNYRLYVAELHGKVVGFCRYYHSSSLPESKKIYPAPEGWYGMGIMVDPSMRRRGIASFLSSNRIEALKAQGATQVYSIVDSKNLTSLEMHQKFGFKEIDCAEGFLQIKLESGKGYLFRLTL